MSTALTSLILVLGLIAATSAQKFVVAKYAISTDVRQHSRIDLDVKDINALLAVHKFGGAKAIYTKGKNSNKSSGKRTLKGFSTDAAIKLKGEPYYELYKKYWKNPAYADKCVVNALDGKGDLAGKPALFREEVAEKSIQYQNVWMYVIHEMEDAICDCFKGNLEDNDGGAKAWDEAWAFYAGSAVGASGKGSGYLLYTLAQKRCANFGTCTCKGEADVNCCIRRLFAKGKKPLLAGNCKQVITVKNDIVKKMLIPLIQGLLRYVVLANGANNADPKVKSHAEGWAFLKAVLPWIKLCNKQSAAILIKNFRPSANPPMRDSVKKVSDAVYKVLKCLGITCKDIGSLPGLPKCPANLKGNFKGVKGAKAVGTKCLK